MRTIRSLSDYLHVFYRVRMIPNPSIHDAQDPETPAIVYPLGGIKVWLEVLARSYANCRM